MSYVKHEEPYLSHKKTKSFGKSILMLTATLAIMLSIPSQASSTEENNSLDDNDCLKVTSRPLSDFLNTQGTLNNPPQFFPEVKDYAGWADVNKINFALIDYAGIANKYIKSETGKSIGTKVNGFVLECKLPNGKTQITVNLLTTKALGFAQSVQNLSDNNFDFLNTPTIFGVKAQDVINGMKPAVGLVFFSTTFSISAPGANLPDFLDVITTTNYSPAKYSFKSTTFGKCSNNETKARLIVDQTALTNSLNEWVYTKEKVDIVDENGGSCRN